MDHRRLARGEVVAVEGDVDVARPAGRSPAGRRRAGAGAWRDGRRGGGCPTSATAPSGFFSTISCAMRTSVRRMSSSSRTTLGWPMRLPSWPRGTGLKDSDDGADPSTGRGRHAGLALSRAARLRRPSSRCARGARARALALEVLEQAVVVLGHPVERPARLELDHEQAQLPRQRGVRPLEPRAAGGGDDRAVDRAVGVDDRAPRRVGLGADRVAGAGPRRGRPWAAGRRGARARGARPRAPAPSGARTAGRRRPRSAAPRVAPRLGSIATSPSAARARSAARSEWRATP